MKKTKEQKGITLIALIITIIILLILAVVSINAIKGDGIIQYAKNAANDYNHAITTEESLLQNYIDQIKGNSSNENTEENSVIALEQAQGKVMSTTASTNVVDGYGNVIKVPAGFKITTDANSVPEGIVIEDCTDTSTKGSQFVWIPVGRVIKADKTEVQIDLNRYSFASDGTPTPQESNLINGGYQEIGTSTNEIAAAKDLNGFISSATNNNGYYIGRYEAGDLESTETNVARSSSTSTENTVVCKVNQQVYNYIGQSKASSLSQAMYSNNEQTNVTSDLTNSYAWDTAIVFIQTFSTEDDASKYSRLNKSSNMRKLTGESGDKYCNINDMSSNVAEWSTESTGESYFNIVFRGGYYTEQWGFSTSNTCGRTNLVSDSIDEREISFRPILYL